MPSDAPWSAIPKPFDSDVPPLNHSSKRCACSAGKQCVTQCPACKPSGYWSALNIETGLRSKNRRIILRFRVW